MAEPESPEAADEREPHIVAERREKLERLRAAGIDPFPPAFPGRVEIAAVHAAHDDLDAGAETEDAYRVAGRITARRGHGKAAFIDLVDATGRLQIHSRADVLGDDAHDQLTRWTSAT